MSKRLNVGCGDWLISGFINLDANPSKPAEIHATVPPLPFDAGEFDEIWACHFLEHLSYEQGREFLRECYRCLKSGGILGLVVPDTREIMTRWLNGAIDRIQRPEGTWWPVADLDAICQIFLYNSFGDGPHRWSYDARTLARAMSAAGFVKLTTIDRYTDPRIGMGAFYQCGFQGVRP